MSDYKQKVRIKPQHHSKIIEHKRILEFDYYVCRIMRELTSSCSTAPNVGVL
jgi:hypothetical protein